MQQTESCNAKKKKYSGFPFKQRLVPVLLVAFAISLTVFIFGPFEIYGTNAEFFEFSLTDFLGWNLLYALGTVAIISAILLPLRGRVFDIVFALFFWIALMLVVQGNYLNFGISALTGDGTSSDGFASSKVIINSVIWGVVGIGCILAVLLIRPQHRDWIRTVAIIAMITVIGMQGITMAVTSMTSDIWSPKTYGTEEPDVEGSSDTDHNSQEPSQSDEGTQGTPQPDDDGNKLPHLLTYQNLDRVSSHKNVIWFVVDRFDATFYEQAREECPEIFYNLDGFTYFDDMTSLYPRTYPSVPYMLTGIERDFFDTETTRVEYMKHAYQNSEFLKLLKKSNYNVNIYTDHFYGYEDARHLEEYVSNSNSVDSVEIVNKPKLSLDMTRLSLFRFLPVAAKNTVGNISTPDFQKYVSYATEYPKYDVSDMKVIYDYLTQNPLTPFDGSNNFTFFHIAGCHLPNKYDANFNEVSKEEQYDSTVAVEQSFKIINHYIDQLKKLGLYENATIIITGDHGSLQGSDTRLPTDASYPNPILTALFVKESGSSGTPLKTSSAPVMQADIIPTILASEGIVTETDFGRSVFEIPEDEIRTRKYNFQSLQSDSSYIVYEYEIIGKARDLNNWKIAKDENGNEKIKHIDTIYN